MKKIIFTTFILAGTFILLESFGPGVLGKKDGTEPGHTGSPGDSLKNCTACHGGVPVSIEGWITSNIPAEGYTPGETYTVTATNKEFGATRFGFQVSPQAINGDLLGTLIITDTSRTKLVGDSKYVTYRADGVEGIDSLSWSFDWTAPVAGTGEVVFYGAFNSNYEGHKEDDKTYLSTLTAGENLLNSLAHPAANTNGFCIYPNPARNLVNVSFAAGEASPVTIELFDLKGRKITTVTHHLENGQAGTSLPTDNIANGVYLLRINKGGKVYVQKLLIQH